MEPGPLLQTLLKEIVRQESSLELPAPRRPPAAVVPARRALCPILIGREQELHTLEEALSSTQLTGGRVVLLTGEAGIGKTRLASELQRLAVVTGMQVMWGGCSETELALPYLPLVEAIGNYLATIELSAVKKRLGRLSRELGQLFPQIEADRPAYDRGEPGQARLWLFEAILALLSMAADPGGLLLVVEDLHWADASTRELLDYLARRLRHTRVAVLVTYRSDEVQRGHPLLPHLQAWERAGMAMVVELRPLPAQDVASMVSAIFDQGAVSGEFRDFMRARTEGNPFVLEEMLKSALDRGDIYRTEAGWDRKALAELKIPPTVRDAILQRLGRLDREHIEVVRTAAVLGESCAYPVLAAVSELPGELVRAALRECVQHQLMEEQTGQLFRFRHALTREAIYEDLLGPERAERHNRAAAALRGMPGIAAAEVANHLVLADRWEEAVPALIQAAEEAEHRRGYPEAADLYGRALHHVVDPLPHARLLCRQAKAYYLVGELARAQPLFEQGIQVLEDGGLTEEAASHRLTLGLCYGLGDLDLARAEFESVRTILEPLGPSESLAQAYAALAGMDVGVYPEKSIEMADHADRVAEAVAANAPRIYAYNYRGSALVQLGYIDEGLRFLDRSWSEAMERDFDDIAGVALANAIDARVWCFRASQAFSLLDRMKTVGALPSPGFPCPSSLPSSAWVRCRWRARLLMRGSPSPNRLVPQGSSASSGRNSRSWSVPSAGPTRRAILSRRMTPSSRDVKTWRVPQRLFECGSTSETSTALSSLLFER